MRHVSESNWYLVGKLDGFLVGLFFLLNRAPALEKIVFESSQNVNSTRDREADTEVFRRRNVSSAADGHLQAEVAAGDHNGEEAEVQWGRLLQVGTVSNQFWDIG